MAFSIFPHTLYSIKSPVNGEIKVMEQFGRRSLKIGGLEQSGPMVGEIWRKALKSITNFQLQISNCLILGLGGGTVVQLIRLKWPEAKITAVEIDPEIIRISKQFFGLDKVKNLKIVNMEALNWLAFGQWITHSNDTYHYSKGFDLVLVDMYLGDQFPKEAESEQFLKSLRKILAKNGVVIFNRLRTDETKSFEKRLKRHFSLIDKIKTPANLLFLARSNV